MDEVAGMGMPQVMNVDGRHTCFYGIAFQIVTIYSLRVCENPLRRLHKVVYIVLHLSFIRAGGIDTTRTLYGVLGVVTLPVDIIMLLLILMMLTVKSKSAGESASSSPIRIPL